jgi:uncharacterized membrane protein YebE (DUF533 family)
MRGPQGPQGSQSAGGGGLADILGQIAAQIGQAGAGGNQTRAAAGAPAGRIPALDELLRNLMPQAAPSTPGQGASAAPTGGLGDILGKLQQQMGGQGGGSLMDVLGQVFNQATAGVREGAQRFDQSTGASARVRDAVSQATGRSPEDLMNQLKQIIAQNQGSAGAVAGGLGAVILGTQAGRALAGQAIKLGALALIGGLAYKAVQNYQQGKPLLDPGQPMALTEAPRGSGFEPAAVTHDSALLYIRGMIAAAAADGRIDAQEQQKIIGGLKQAGLDAEAEEFLANELNNPANAADLSAAVKSDQEAVQLFTAARIAIDLDNEEEHEFLVTLAQRLGLDDQLIAHIDAEARAT